MRIRYIYGHAPAVSPNTTGNRHEDIIHSRACSQCFSEYYGEIAIEI